MPDAIKPSDKINAITFYTNYGNDPCAYLRLRGPMRQLGIKVIDGTYNGIVYPDRVSQSDAVVMQRDFPRDQDSYHKILQRTHQEKKPVIYDIDDLLFLMPEEHPDRQSLHYIESLLPMTQALYEADLLTTTTPLLQEFLLQFNENVYLLPNYFDDGIWQFKTPKFKDKEPLIIGYMGSESHAPDLKSIEPALEDILKQYPDQVMLYFWGVRPPSSIASYPQVKWIPAVTYRYEEFAGYFQTQNADIFIAPLIDNHFNRSKSPLKFFEYSSLGAPGIYSRLDTFTQAITDKKEGLLASTHEEWLENLTLLIENPSTRLEIAQQAQQTIKEKWLLSKNANKWVDAYQAIYPFNTIELSPDISSYQLIKSINHQYSSLIQTKDKTIRTLTQVLDETRIDLDETRIELDETRIVLEDMRTSKLWRILLKLRNVWNKLAPIDSKRRETAYFFIHWLKNRKLQTIKKNRKKQQDLLLDSDTLVTNCAPIDQFQEPTDIIICVHNALEFVKKCLHSVLSNTSQPFNLIIIDDGSDLDTKRYLEDFSSTQPNCMLIRNEIPLGYTKAANVGMKASKAEFFVLLNSDTIVTPKWIERLYRALIHDQRNGIAGPLSNTASWQSIPKLSENGDWAINRLPNGITADAMSELIAKYSACIHPEVPLLNGFCMMIRKEVLNEIGFFDEDNFGQGYGEEDDFVIRAGKSGWKIVIADDAYIYHAQSKSYTSNTRFALQSQSGKKLTKKHGTNTISEKVAFMHDNRVMEGIRARSRIMLEREAYIENGWKQFSNRRILFILPVRDAGGGANVILDEAICMQKMGVEVHIFNLAENQPAFSQNYQHVDIPFIFRKSKDLPAICKNYDAVIASANYSVPWLEPIDKLPMKPILGYYIQGFEPLMFPKDSPDYDRALKSYTLINEFNRFTKTEWTRKTVKENTGADSQVVGISVNIDLFRPRHMLTYLSKPIVIVAMVRPGSSYRNPEMTLKILKEISKKLKNDVDIWLFGADDLREVVHEMHLDFKWRHLGKLSQVQVASMMSKADIFVDFSSHQAMGLSALEAMAAGCSVVVPKHGGAVEFVEHNVNGKIADTANMRSSLETLVDLIENDNLRQQIQINAINDVVQYFPEKAGYNILKTLFLE